MELQQAKGSATRARSSNKPPSKSRRWFSTPVRALRCYGCALAILGLLGFLTPTGAIWAFVCGCLLTCCDTEHTDASMRNQVHCARQCAIIGIIFSLLTIVGCVVTGMYLWLDNTTVCSSAGAALTAAGLTDAAALTVATCTTWVKNYALLVVVVPSLHQLACIALFVVVVCKALELERQAPDSGDVIYTSLDGSKAHQTLSLAAERSGALAGCGVFLFFIAMFMLLVTANDPNKPRHDHPVGTPPHDDEDPLMHVDYMVRWMLIVSGSVLGVGVLGTIAFSAAADLH